VVTLLYGCGLLPQECLALRVKDVDFQRREISVRRAKGQKERRVMLPDCLVDPLREHLTAVQAPHTDDLAHGLHRVGGVSCHTFCHSLVTAVLKAGYDILTVQELVGHADVRTTMVYTHVLNRAVSASRVRPIGCRPSYPVRGTTCGPFAA
jgi:site-specific recombinase XerD